jgi:hypothetical protein
MPDLVDVNLAWAGVKERKGGRVLFQLAFDIFVRTKSINAVLSQKE